MYGSGCQVVAQTPFSLLATLRKRFQLAETGKLHELVQQYLADLQSYDACFLEKYRARTSNESLTAEQVYDLVTSKVMRGSPAVGRSILCGQRRAVPDALLPGARGVA